VQTKIWRIGGPGSKEIQKYTTYHKTHTCTDSKTRGKKKRRRRRRRRRISMWMQIQVEIKPIFSRK